MKSAVTAYVWMEFSDFRLELGSRQGAPNLMGYRGTGALDVRLGLQLAGVHQRDRA